MQLRLGGPVRAVAHVRKEAEHIGSQGGPPGCTRSSGEVQQGCRGLKEAGPWERKGLREAET